MSPLGERDAVAEGSAALAERLDQSLATYSYLRDLASMLATANTIMTGGAVR